MKKLEILIPQYNESEEIIKTLLDSIAIQQNINFKDIGVVICNDGSDVILSQEFLDGYDFQIKYVMCEHKGVSATRNTCLDNATADYVMFCDADDMFYNACAMYIIFREIEQGFDTLTSIFVEETRNQLTGEPKYISRDNDDNYVHGKVHNRQFLMKNNIRWNENLTIHEDSMFNILCKTVAKDFKYINTPFYLWKWRQDSVCRHDKKYRLKTYTNLLDSNTVLLRELLVRGYIKEARQCTVSMVFNTYYTMNQEEWRRKENKRYRKNAERRFKKYYLDFKPLFDTIDENEKVQIIATIRNRMFREGLVLEKITFEQWLKKIKCVK